MMMRWFAVPETRVVECDDPVNCRYVDAGSKASRWRHRRRCNKFQPRLTACLAGFFVSTRNEHVDRKLRCTRPRATHCIQSGWSTRRTSDLTRSSRFRAVGQTSQKVDSRPSLERGRTARMRRLHPFTGTPARAPADRRPRTGEVGLALPIRLASTEESISSGARGIWEDR
jgi:hypothetical protein